MTDAQCSPQSGSILQLKVRLLGISPMIWRCLLVRETMSLHELHGVLQVAMGWEGIHLFQFSIRGTIHSKPCLNGPGGIDTPLSTFRFRQNGKFRYIYDMNCWWDHELRIEDRTNPVPAKHYPVCIGGSGFCPPEDCGGPEGYYAGLEEAFSPEAMDDLRLFADFIRRLEIARDNPSLLLEDEDMHFDLEMAAERCEHRALFLTADRFRRGPVNKRFRADEHQKFMHRQATFA